MTSILGTKAPLKSASQYPSRLCENIKSELVENRRTIHYTTSLKLLHLTNWDNTKKGIDKFRTMTDLSSPKDLSGKDFIPASVQFHHFDEAIKLVGKLGTGALLAKLDIKSAFRICPVRKTDWHLLGFSFQDMYFVDLCLPFGLRSSVNRFSQLADAVLWILQNNYSIVNSTNYLDDCFFAGPAKSSVCQQNLNKAMTLFSNLGIPLAPNKIK